MIESTRIKDVGTPLKDGQENVEKHVAILMNDPRLPGASGSDEKLAEYNITVLDRLAAAFKSAHGFDCVLMDNHRTLIEDLATIRGRVDFVFNLLDEGFLNRSELELHMPAFLEMLDIPYTGAGPACIAITVDKSLCRGICKDMGIPVANGIFLGASKRITEMDLEQLQFPVIVKPNAIDGSIGITRKSICNDIEAVQAAIDHIHDTVDPEMDILIEEFLPGKDLTIGIIGNPDVGDVVTSPVVEEDYSSLPAGLPRLCCDEAKWDPSSPYWCTTSIRAALDHETEKNISDWSVQLFKRVGCRDYARFDWRIDKAGVPRVLDFNANCSLVWDGHLAKAFSFAGFTYEKMIQLIFESAQRRIALDKKRHHAPVL